MLGRSSHHVNVRTSAAPATSPEASGVMVALGKISAGDEASRRVTAAMGAGGTPRRRPVRKVSASPRANHSPPVSRPAVTRSSAGVRASIASAMPRVAV